MDPQSFEGLKMSETYVQMARKSFHIFTSGIIRLHLIVGLVGGFTGLHVILTIFFPNFPPHQA